MSFRLKNKKLLKLIGVAYAALLAVAILFLVAFGTVFYEFDYKILDQFHRMAVKKGYGPGMSDFPQIKYITITDETYAYVGNNYLDRSFLASLNNALESFDIQAAAYDIIFSRPTNLASDNAFTQSLESLGRVYLPIGLKLEDTAKPFAWGNGAAYETFKASLAQPEQKGIADPLHKPLDGPYYGSWGLMQHHPFASAAVNSGHISSHTDTDGVSRHMPMIIKVDKQFFPCLALAMFLDYAGVPFEKTIIHWGQHIRIPAIKGSFLDEDLIIPIDQRGRTFIPFPQTWENGFEEMPAHLLMETMVNESLSGNLLEIFEGNFVFIGDISMGISDLGNTPLQSDVPLIVLHTAMLNAMLTNQFYTKWPFGKVLALITAIAAFIGLSALPRSSALLYISGIASIAGIVCLAWFQYINFSLLPVVTIINCCLFITVGLIVSIEIVTSKDRTYIRNVFARYVPEKVVNHLLVNPEQLKLGGELREISLLMSDLRGFTALCASRTPEEVVRILNRYFEKMVTIILDHKGIIDEFIGDGILAFFGAPEPDNSHSEKAVACALSMQAAMAQINAENRKDGLPELNMGIAVNSGEVVLGNIGSEKRTKYGVVGSEVNYTGRAESYTVGGQVLITRSTYEKLSDILQINKTMDVKMKGAPQKATLYDVTGIKEPYNIFLHQKKEPLIKLTARMQVSLFMLDAKMVAESGIPTWITHLGENSARIIMDEAISEFQNIKLIFPDAGSGQPDGDKGNDPSEIYAKVVSSTKRGEAYETALHFTYVSQSAADILKTAS